MSDLKARSWVFTYHYDVNEYVKAKQDVESLNDGSCLYYCYGEEVCPTTNRPHFQGYVRFRNAKRFATLKKKYPTWHFEVAKGTGVQNVLYTSKTRSEDVNAGKTPGDVENGCQPWFEWGERPDDAGHLKGWLYTLNSFKEEFEDHGFFDESKILTELCEEIYDYFEELDFDLFGESDMDVIEEEDSPPLKRCSSSMY